MKDKSDFKILVIIFYYFWVLNFYWLRYVVFHIPLFSRKSKA